VTERPPANASDTAVDPLFHEVGASWYWVLTGPLCALGMLWMEISSGLGTKPIVPLAFLVLVSGFLSIQIKAARIHASVELTEDTLRQGTEELPVEQILRVHQELPVSLKSGREPHKWQSARALGELTGVPRGRIGIGLKLTEDRTVQAWARKHHQLRALLTELVARRSSGSDGQRPNTQPK
jgi:hypothetical protein